MRIRPLGDRVVIKRVETEEVTKGGILLAGSAKEKPQEAVVVAIGPGTYSNGVLINMEVQVGNKVLFSKFAGTEVKVDGEEYIILKQEEILAVLG